ncbi:MAG: hypothetical protein CFH10_01960 [Alphaproteobacteria bacterium MarineAlpha4_Bin2]|nr:MAG: hypothetical protein CFH10_01960 [Alphaproteobacteria bacterium MarineAlpha4_Bin2]
MLGRFELAPEGQTKKMSGRLGFDYRSPQNGAYLF